MPSRIAHCFVAVLTSSFLASVAVGDVASDINRFDLFTECSPMHLLVEGLHEDATKIGLTEEAIQATAESRLRSARLYSSEADPYLYINVNVVGPAFSDRLQFRKTLFDPLTGLSFPAATWQIGAAGTHGRDAGYILSTVSQHLDQFLVEFLRVNEEACGKR